MTLEEYFDGVAAHLLQQMTIARGPRSLADKEMGPRYRDFIDRRSPLGCMATFYDDVAEGAQLSEIYIEDGKWVALLEHEWSEPNPCVPALIKMLDSTGLPVTYDVLDAVARLEYVHDRCPPPTWEKWLNTMAEKIFGSDSDPDAGDINGGGCDKVAT